MIKYIITSEAFTGEAVLTYNEAGQLPMVDCFNTNMRADQHRWLLRWICEMTINHEALIATLKVCNLPNLTFKQVTFEPTFGDFWAQYFKNRHKDNSSKRRAEIRWNRMSKGEQLSAYNHIGKYFSQINDGVQPKYAETYLNAELWNN